MAQRLRFSAAAAYRSLRAADPVIGALIEQHGPYKPRPSGEPYAALVRAIMHQQLAGPAARTIMGRMVALFGDDEHTPTPEEILAMPDPAFREAGVSRQKTSYLKDLAAHVATGDLDFDGMDTLSDDEVIRRLTAVHGIGEWTAHMFLMFQLGRPDILPVGDLGVCKGMKIAYGLRSMPTPKRAKKIGAAWSPYASVASWYMWRVADTVTPD